MEHALRKILADLLGAREDLRDMLEMQNLPYETMRFLQGKSQSMQIVITALQELLMAGETEDEEEDDNAG